MRLDLYLVKSGHCSSRSKASELIQSGAVQVLIDDRFKIITSPSFKMGDTAQLKITEQELLKYVARSGLKLEAALDELGINVKGLCALDIGQSTGGFTDCLLQRGAEHIVGIDVGHDQLSSKIKKQSNVQFYEGVNARDLLKYKIKDDQSFSDSYSGFFDFCCIDVSFISLSYIFSQVTPLLKKEGLLLALVKPQFEVGQKFLKNGVVSDPEVYESLQTKIEGLIAAEKLTKLNYVSSQLPGKKGNKEFFVYAKK